MYDTDLFKICFYTNCGLIGFVIIANLILFVKHLNAGYRASIRRSILGIFVYNIIFGILTLLAIWFFEYSEAIHVGVDIALNLAILLVINIVKDFCIEYIENYFIQHPN